VIAMMKMRVLQLARAEGPIELLEREMPEPHAGEVEACGVCHSDVFTGAYPRL
jgi:D-arabinose 1-dehydrogenase-like Zn-dependent alcohol dehydrogenase